MLVLGIILIVIGALMALFGRREGETFAFWGGAIIFAGGVILFVIAILDRSGADTAAFVGGGLAMAVPGRHAIPLDQDPPQPVAGSTADREPVIVAFVIGAIPMLAAFVLQVVDEGGVQIPAWLRSLLAGLGAVVTGLAALWARTRVTPTALPQLDEGTPLVPMVESEHTT